MVAAGDHRRGGAAPERGEGRGKRIGGPRLTPVGDRNGEVDEVGEVAANPKKATPKREKVRGDDGGGPELGGLGGGESGRMRGKRARKIRPPLMRRRG
uniref:Pr1-like protein n=1 Tax=Oryza sativa subsp. japonica TaxID=39947 RepID=Q6UU69_ORYSJ|nr:hypothetical protein OSJNBa0023H09.28 [Oryza sativa Japonica Group]